MRKFNLLMLISALSLPLLLASCASTKMRSNLSPEDKDFTSKVRYIITKEESKIFSELPPSARADFIEKFWKRRDPDPDTEMNEYRNAYFARIEEANRLFRGGGRPGWLQDRGRIYILFGPPNERMANPMGGQPVDPYEDPREMISSSRVSVGEKPTEWWVYYNLFSSMSGSHIVRLVFVDTLGTGDYKLSTNLEEAIPGTMGAESFIDPNLVFSHDLHKEVSERTRAYDRKALFDFSWEFLPRKDRELGSNLSIYLALPYKRMIFIQKEDRLTAKLNITIRIKSLSDALIWQFEDEQGLDFSEEFIRQNKDDAWKGEIPVQTWLKKGNYLVYIRLQNISGDQEIEKLLPLKM